MSIDFSVTTMSQMAGGATASAASSLATGSLMGNAAAQVEPVVYLQGQNIIREGERVQANQLAMLEALGLRRLAAQAGYRYERGEDTDA